MTDTPRSSHPDLFDVHPLAGRIAWLGCDVGKETFDAAIHPPVPPDTPARPLDTLVAETFPRTSDGARQCLAWVDQHLAVFAQKEGLAVAPSLRVVMEVTGRYSIELAAWILEQRPSTKPSVIDPIVSHHALKSRRLRNKTDRLEARALACHGAERVPPPHENRPAQYDQLRELSRERDYAVETLVAARNRAGELPAGSPVVRLHRRIVTDLESSLERIEKAIRKHVEKHEDLRATAARLQTIPGVGFWTSVVLLAELGDLARFLRSRQITAYAGVSPRRYESGTSVKGRTRLCKQGVPRVRQALYMSAMAAVRGDNDLGRFHRHLVEEGKPKRVALGAVMRKQLVIARSLIVHQTVYQDGHGAPRQQVAKKEAPPCG
jgi:transposase